MTVPNLTAFILAHLQPLHVDHILPRGLRSRAFAKRLNRFPQEIIDMILRYLLPWHELPLPCKRLLAPIHWRRLLLKDGIFPWLWDIDHRVTADHGFDVRDEDLTVSEYMDVHWADNGWDWELLVRELAQSNVFEPGSTMQYAPSGLRNRRRIWRVLEEMRVDDVRHGRRRRRRRRRVLPREEDTTMEDAMAPGEERVVEEQMADEEMVEE